MEWSLIRSRGMIGKVFFVVGIEVSLMFALSAPQAHAATFTVSTTSDTNATDAAKGDGVCATALGDCTLRAAVEEVNARKGGDVISFNIASSEAETIVLNSSLPVIAAASTTVDGTTEAGSSCGDLWSGIAPIWNVVIDLQDTGITFSGGSAKIRGLELTNSTAVDIPLDFIGGDANTAQCNYIHHTARAIRVGSGSDRNLIGGTAAGDGNLLSYVTGEVVVVNTANDTRIQGNFIGTNAAGDAITNNAFNPNDLQFGINVGKDTTVYPVGTIIGGSTPRAGNLIDGFTGQAGFGIAVVSGDHTTIQGNYLGTDRRGISSDETLGNSAGIILQPLSSLTTIGGTSALARNVIGNSVLAGVLNLSSPRNIVQGNFIGLGADGTSMIRNKYGVVFLGSTATDNLIGGTTTGTGNVIANNTDIGILLAGDPGYGYGATGGGNSVLGNAIYNNPLGIDISANPMLMADDVTANDPLDADRGPNNLQNYPDLKRATGLRTRAMVSGKLISTPGETFRLEFFWTPGSFSGQGKVFLGAKEVKTNARGTKSFAVRNLIPLPGLVGVITATATDSKGNTSEFSAGIVPRLLRTATPQQEASVEREFIADEE